MEKNFKKIGVVVAATVVVGAVVIAGKKIERNLKASKEEINELKEGLKECRGQLEAIENSADESLEIIKKHLDNSMTNVKEEVHRAVSSVIEKKFDTANNQVTAQAKKCYEDINQSLDKWRKDIAPVLVKKVMEDVKEEMVKTKLDVSEEVIKAMLFQTSRGMIDEIKEELEDQQAGLISQYVNDASRDMNILKNGIKQILIIECMKNGLSAEQAEQVVTGEKIQEIITEMSNNKEEYRGKEA